MSSDVLFAPCEPVQPGDEQVRLLLLKSSFNVVLLPAWSSLERLLAACGDNQAWAGVRLQEVDNVRAAAGAAAVLLDPETGVFP